MSHSFPGDFNEIVIDKDESFSINIQTNPEVQVDELHARFTDVEIADGYIYLTDSAKPSGNQIS